MTRRRRLNTEDQERAMDALFASFDSTHYWVRVRGKHVAFFSGDERPVEASHA